MNAYDMIYGEPMPKSRIAVLSCSFCGKTTDQVNHLVAGPAVYICDECVDLCAEICENDRTKHAAPVDSDPPGVLHIHYPGGIQALTGFDLYMDGYGPILRRNTFTMGAGEGGRLVIHVSSHDLLESFGTWVRAAMALKEARKAPLVESSPVDDLVAPPRVPLRMDL